MKPIVAWFARNIVAANLLMVAIMVGGLISALAIKVELFPEFSLDMISVRVIYPGAAPEEVEEGICIRIEEEVHGIEGVEEVTSSASEGIGTVMIEVRTGEDPRRVLDDIKTRVDAIETFPEEAERPVIEELLMRSQVINVAVFGDTDEVTLKSLGERVRDEINAIDGISQVELTNARPYEISIEVSEEALRRHGLTFDDVADAVRRSSLDLSGGSIKTEGGEILLRTVGQAYRGSEFEEAVVLTRPDGTRIHVRDVARVVDGFVDTDQQGRFNGLPVVMIQVFRVGDESALAVAESVHQYIATLRPELPEGIQIEAWQDASRILSGRLDLLVKNGLQGLALVFLVLALFLRFRLSVWVSIGIPLSFLGAFLVLDWFGQSLNMLSLFAFILVLGIVVDDAIVVGENIHRRHEEGDKGVVGSVKGAQRVVVPVVFAVLTTVLAFLPLFAIPGIMGKFIGTIPVAVIASLLFSLIESQLILPAHLAHETAFSRFIGTVRPFRWWVGFQERISRGLMWFIEHVYRPALSLCLEWRYLTLAVGIATLLGAGGLVAAGFIKFNFFPDIEGDVVAAQITMPEGTSADATERAVRRVEEAAAKVRRELEGDGSDSSRRIVQNFMSSIGEQPFSTQRQGPVGGGGAVGSHLGEVVIELVPSEEREMTALEVTDRWREVCGPIAGVSELTFTSALMHAGDPIHVRFSGPNVDELAAAADELKAALANYEGVYDIRHTFREGKNELVLDVKPSAEALGVSRMDLARQVRQGFYGEEAQRIQRGRDDLKVMVRYPEEDRRTLHGLESMRVRTRDGGEIPFSAVATAGQRKGFSTINRTERHRMVDVTASLDLKVASAGGVLAGLEADVLPGILASHKSVYFSFEGQTRDQAETMEAASRLFLFALLAMFGLMAIPFRSYVQPAIIMSAIPFGLVGAIAGHGIMGVNFSIMSVFGIMALAGVVVNDSLVLVDFVNRNVQEGKSALDAARLAGIARFRPILLTSLTTFASLAPLILWEKSVQAQFLIPMAISLAFGVVFSTVISLILVPAIYLVLEDIRSLVRGIARFLGWLYGPVEPRVAP